MILKLGLDMHILVFSLSIWIKNDIDCERQNEEHEPTDSQC